MEHQGVAVGVLLAICTTMPTAKDMFTRCCFSAWYVEPEFRVYGALPVIQAIRNKDVTFLNISPMSHTFPIIEAMGFQRYSEGTFAALPIFNLLSRRRITVLAAHEKPTVAFEPYEQTILLDHAAFGCTSFWCVTPERAYPFVFRMRMIKGIIPAAQLVYCRDIADFAQFAGSIGRFLALHGQFVVLFSANEPMPRLVGRFFRGKTPKYFKGRHRPRLGDLAYTEAAVLGV
jgi:hypothetical protein